MPLELIPHDGENYEITESNGEACITYSPDEKFYYASREADNDEGQEVSKETYDEADDAYQAYLTGKIEWINPCDIEQDY
jgi:ABC-type oligopeptide transport system substrate-binding subunit